MNTSIDQVPSVVCCCTTLSLFSLQIVCIHASGIFSFTVLVDFVRVKSCVNCQLTSLPEGD